MDIPDQEFTLDEVAVSTSNDQAMIELTKALSKIKGHCYQPLLRNQNKYLITVEELCEIESKKQSSTKIAKTKWGMKFCKIGALKNLDFN